MQSNWTGIGIAAHDRQSAFFCEIVERLSGGRVTVTNYDAEVLLGIGETFTGVSDGVADCAITASVYHRGIVPVGLYTWAVPFTVESVEEFEVIYHELGATDILSDAYAEHGVKFLNYQLSDEWGTCVTTFPADEYADFEGKKVRAFGLWADWMVENGASITVVPGGEIYMAIQTGVLDAAHFGAPNSWAGMKVAEVADYLIYPSIIPYDMNEVIMTLETFNEMPADLQEIMVAAARLTNEQMSAYTVVQDVQGWRDLEAQGIEFMRMPDDELLKAKVWCWQKFLDSRGEDPYIDRLIDIYVEYMEIKEDYFGWKRLP
jgi:TRAP-type mannitol/chloroaromatic compound transport system substrate-binding protein